MPTVLINIDNCSPFFDEQRHRSDHTDDDILGNNHYIYLNIPNEIFHDFQFRRFPIQKKMKRKYLIMKFRYRTEQERATKKIPIPRGYHARTQKSICFQHTSYLISHFLNNIKELHKARLA